MPDLNAFPKSHVVTFEYYVGVIWFLEEDYAKVSLMLWEADYKSPYGTDTNTRPRNTLQTHGDSATAMPVGIASSYSHTLSPVI